MAALEQGVKHGRDGGAAAEQHPARRFLQWTSDGEV